MFFIEFNKILSNVTNHLLFNAKSMNKKSNYKNLTKSIDNYCVSITTFGILIAIATFLITTFAGVLFVYLFINTNTLTTLKR